MHNVPGFVSPKSVYLKIEVRRNDDDDTFDTNLCCALGQCGKMVEIDSGGPKTVQNVFCPKHGFLTSFLHQVALGEFVRCLANKILEENGDRLIDVEASFIIGDKKVRRESMN